MISSMQQAVADLVFFSSQSLDANGIISDTTEEENYLRQKMLLSAKLKFLLSFVLSVAASVVAYYICKWLDNNDRFQNVHLTPCIPCAILFLST